MSNPLFTDIIKRNICLWLTRCEPILALFPPARIGVAVSKAPGVAQLPGRYNHFLSLWPPLGFGFIRIRWP